MQMYLNNGRQICQHHDSIVATKVSSAGQDEDKNMQQEENRYEIPHNQFCYHAKWNDFPMKVPQKVP